MTKKKAPKKSSTKPVIYVHAKDRSVVSSDQVQALAELDLPVYTRLEVEGARQTIHGYDQPLHLLAELHREQPGRPVIFLRAGLHPSAALIGQLDQLARTVPSSILVPLSNADVLVNPFAGLQAPDTDTGLDYSGMVSLLAPGKLHTLSGWFDHFAFFTAEAVERLTETAGDIPLQQQLSRSGIKLLAADHLFLHDPQARVFTKLDLQPYESLCPPPFGELSARLQAWMDAGIDSLPVAPGGKPATLHITHSWGGGVAQWIETFIEADDECRHFQLRSEHATSNQSFGQKLSLYVGNELRCPIASWWLQPPIHSMASTDDQVKNIVAEVCNRFGIARVIVSSLIGHSLDTLRTGLPTVQILHDHFPAWPLLGVNPEPYLSDGNPADLKQAFADHKNSRHFIDQDGPAWSAVCADYLEAMSEFGVKVAAPGQWVLDLQNRIEPGFTGLESTVIAHGFPSLEDLHPVTPKPRADGRLRMVILGRMQEGKGAQLLRNAIPELSRHVQVYLVGSGKPGEIFFGTPGVNVIPEYDRKELGALLNDIGPDFAALISTVPETFSYTLSELQQSRIPAIATRLGSFIARVEHGKTGWLVDADTGALNKQVIELCRDPGQIETVRRNLASVTENSAQDMVKAYNRFCPASKTVQAFAPAKADSAQVQWAAADYQLSLIENELRKTEQKSAKLSREIDQIANWAHQEVRIRQEWQAEAKRLTEEFEAQVAWALQLSEDLERKRNEAHLYQDRLQQLQSDYLITTTRLESILQSNSWKLTLPLRVIHRVLKNFMLVRAWNPLRWPWLAASLVRTLNTKGFTGTLRRMQTNPSEEATGNDADTASTNRRSINAKDLADEAAVTVAQAQSEPRPGIVVPGPFECPDQPDVSIIIPVYNQWPHTAACLASLLEARCQHTFEVIIVDDQSSDGTQEQLAQVEGIKYFRNEQNQGFVGSCNRGADNARGEYLVLLNNDTEVTDDWLDELIHVFEIEPRAGLVGSRLVYPDGRLQESGGVIFNDASGWNYGRDDDPERPEYKYLREADYCSGACIMLKTGFFHELGSLDERYSPAYYEDTDLAFRVREAGYKVMVQPWSTVIHFEGLTSGTDTSSGTKRYQLINQEKFLDRWRDTLKNQPPPVADPYNKSAIRKASIYRNKGQVLFIDAHTPKPDRDSGSVRLINLMYICRELGYGVTFFADNRAKAGHYTRDLQKSGIEVLYTPWLQSLSEFFRGRGDEFDYIFISRHYVATNYLLMLKRYCPNAHFIFDTVDLHYLRERRLAELENSASLKIAARQTRRAELNVVKAAAATLVVSPVEKAVLAEDAPDARVHVLSNIHHVPGRDKAFSERKDICFIGGYQHPPNIDAAQWFVKDIWPIVHAQLPDMKFHLVGSEAPDHIRELEGDGVVFHGFAESLEPFLNGCRLAIAPLRYGAGVKGKVNMSMAHGQPMVLTSAAAEGLFGEHEREYLLADDAESFAREIVRLYQDETLWNSLSDACVRNVEEHFSVAAARKSLAELFDSFDS